MHFNSKDITGQKFGRLTAIRPTDERRNNCVVWECLCLCGNKCFVSTDYLRNKHTRSCGCLKQECRYFKHIHGKARTPIYKVWRGMFERCYNPNSKDFKDYGGRGIKVCKHWHKFENFYEDMGDRPEGKTLDRWPDNDGNYKLENCRWATLKQQNGNRRPISCGPNKQHWFRAWHKDSMAQYLSNNRHKFAQKWGLFYQSISNCLHKRQKQHKGWKFEFLKTDI